MSRLFSPVTVGPLEVRSRVWVPPMCQYSAVDGLATDEHPPATLDAGEDGRIRRAMRRACWV